MPRGVPALLLLLPCLAACGLLMDFEPGGDDGAGGAPSATGIVSGSGQTGTSEASASSDVSSVVSSVQGASSSSGGEGGHPTESWSVTLGELNGGLRDEKLRALAIGKNGRIAIAGELAAPIRIGGIDLEVTPPELGTFVAVFDPPGNTVWARKMTTWNPTETASEQDEIDIAFAEDGNLVVMGSVAQHVDFDESESYTVTSDQRDLYYAAYGPTGLLAKGKPYPAAGTQHLGAIDIRGLDSIYATGSYCGGAQFGDAIDCAGAEEFVCDDGRTDIFVVEIDADGVCKQLVDYVSNGAALATDIDVDDDGGFILSGQIDTSIDLGITGGPLTLGLPTLTAFVASFADLDTADYAHVVGMGAVRVVRDPVEGFRFAGAVEGSVLGSGETAGGTDFVAAYVEDATQAGPATFLGGAEDDGGFLVRGPEGWRVYGSFDYPAQFDDSNLLGEDGLEGFAATLDDEGRIIASSIETFHGPGHQVIVAAGFDDQGREIIAGHFQGDADIAGLPFDSLGGFDIFVAARPVSAIP